MHMCKRSLALESFCCLCVCTSFCQVPRISNGILIVLLSFFPPLMVALLLLLLPLLVVVVFVVLLLLLLLLFLLQSTVVETAAYLFAFYKRPFSILSICSAVLADSFTYLSHTHTHTIFECVWSVCLSFGSQLSCYSHSLRSRCCVLFPLLGAFRSQIGIVRL